MNSTLSQVSVFDTNKDPFFRGVGATELGSDASCINREFNGQKC